MLKVNEIFGPTIQGEGPSAGRPALFVRLANCNLSCTWCDTKYTWDWKNYDFKKEIHSLEEIEVVSKLKELQGEERDPELIVITGGEPLLQQETGLVHLFQLLWSTFGRIRIEIETAGTLAPGLTVRLVDLHYNVSPKLEHSGNDSRRYNREALESFVQMAGWGRASFKFVVQNKADLDEIERDYVGPLKMPLESVFCMLEGSKDSQNAWPKDLAEEIVRRGWGISPRLHTQIWGEERAT